MPDADKILAALATAIKALDVVKVTAEEVGAMFQRLLDIFSPTEPETLHGAALSPLCNAIVDKAAERLAAD
jgi:hypothetical protein